MRKEEFLCVGCDFKWRAATFWSCREAARSSSNKREWKLEWVLESTRQRQKFTVGSRSSQIEDKFTQEVSYDVFASLLVLYE
jgi:hypothetical protein